MDYLANVENSEIDVSGIRTVLVQGDSSYPIIRFVLDPSLTGLSWRVRGTYTDTNIAVLSPEITAVESASAVTLDWSVGSDFTTYGGDMQLVLVGSNDAGTTVVKALAEITIQKDWSIGTMQVVTLNLFEQLMAQASATIAKYPYIDEATGRWFVWNPTLGEWVDTGESANGSPSYWYTGTTITGTDATPTAFPSSGITEARLGDMYLNESTANVYRCTLAGNAATALWSYRANIKGADAVIDATSTNLLINGNFAVNQRAKSGTVTLAAGAYGHDRWKAGASGCTYTFATSANVTTLTISAGSLVQVVEGVNLQSGTVCLSWTGTAQGKIGSGSYSASGVTGTATGGTNLNIEFNTGTLSKVQLNYGSVALPFVLKARNEDHLAYYQPDVARGATGYANGTVANISIRLPRGMRATPTPTLAYADYVIVGASTISVVSIAAIARINDALYVISLNLGSSVAANTVCATANTVINLDAEL